MVKPGQQCPGFAMFVAPSTPPATWMHTRARISTGAGSWLNPYFKATGNSPCCSYHPKTACDQLFHLLGNQGHPLVTLVGYPYNPWSQAFLLSLVTSNQGYRTIDHTNRLAYLPKPPSPYILADFAWLLVTLVTFADFLAQPGLIGVSNNGYGRLFLVTFRNHEQHVIQNSYGPPYPLQYCTNFVVTNPLLTGRLGVYSVYGSKHLFGPPFTTLQLPQRIVIPALYTQTRLSRYCYGIIDLWGKERPALCGTSNFLIATEEPTTKKAQGQPHMIECNYRGKTHGDRVGETILGAKKITLTAVEVYEDQIDRTNLAANAVKHKSSKGRRKWRSACPVCFTQMTFNGNCDCD